MDPFKELANRAFREMKSGTTRRLTSRNKSIAKWLRTITSKKEADNIEGGRGNGKYAYVRSFVQYADDIDMRNLYDAIDEYGAGRLMDNSRAKNKNVSVALLPKIFIGALKQFLRGDKDARAILYKFLGHYADFYSEHKKDSHFIEKIYGLLPSEFVKGNTGGLSASASARGGGKTRKVTTSDGKVFQVENPTKKWTQAKKYKKWLGKLTRKQKTHTKEEDLCVGKESICKGDLGIPRKYMPQFNSPAEIAKFRKFVKKVYRIKSFRATRKASVLKPSQGEINRKRIDGLIKEGVLDKVNVPIIVSGDNYVVDGHHRWAAYRLKKPESKLPAVVIDAPIKDVLGIAVAWGAKHQEF